MAETNRKNDGAPQVPAQALGTQALAAGFCAFQNLVQGNLDLIYRADAADRLEWIAPAGLHLLGYETAEPLLGRDAAVLYCHPQERAALREAVARGTGPVCQEEILRCADGGSLVVRSRAVRRTDATGAPAGMEVHSLVLSGELEARLNLARALREMETIFNNALVGMALVRKAHIEKINVRGLELLGYPASRLVGTDLDFLFPTPEAHHCFLEALRQDLSATGVHIGEYSLVRGDGASLIMARTYAPESAAPRPAESFSPERASIPDTMGSIGKTHGVRASSRPNPRNVTNSVGRPPASVADKPCGAMACGAGSAGSSGRGTAPCGPGLDGAIASVVRSTVLATGG